MKNIVKDKILRVIKAYKRTLSKKLKRRSALDRYKSRQYYRKHKTKIKVQRKKYMKKNKIFMKSRKLFKRTKPSWVSKKKKFKIPKPKIHKPKTRKPGKVHAPKRKVSKRS